ncbi:inositol monophosphatase family protein [Nocardia sp. NPDC050408]|uniref:inositol monophosphatase family protein n=1 Tax=Nocardia sp. NPDC050408 TaxID=3364319 RepID=UPI00379C3931
MSLEVAAMLDVARAAVARGCELLRTAGPGEVRSKDDRDFVTDLDVRIQNTVRQYLENAAAGVDFLGEEADGTDTAGGSRYRWILDPIDGTSNFIHGLPLCAVSLALTCDDVPIVGVIGAPFLSLEYHASTGEGAFCNGRRITASATKTLSNAIVSIGDYAVGAGAAAKNQRRLAVTAALAEQVERVRMLGSAALDLVWVAEGRIDACVLLSNNPWDVAAGVLLAREAGAVVADSDGSNHTLTSAHTVAANPQISDALLKLLAATDPLPDQG